LGLEKVIQNIENPEWGSYRMLKMFGIPSGKPTNAKRFYAIFSANARSIFGAICPFNLRNLIFGFSVFLENLWFSEEKNTKKAKKTQKIQVLLMTRSHMLRIQSGKSPEVPNPRKTRFFQVLSQSDSSSSSSADMSSSYM
jgi:hypothetical protein